MMSLDDSEIRALVRDVEFGEAAQAMGSAAVPGLVCLGQLAAATLASMEPPIAVLFNWRPERLGATRIIVICAGDDGLVWVRAYEGGCLGKDKLDTIDDQARFALLSLHAQAVVAAEEAGMRACKAGIVLEGYVVRRCVSCKLFESDADAAAAVSELLSLLEKECRNGDRTVGDALGRMAARRTASAQAAPTRGELLNRAASLGAAAVLAKEAAARMPTRKEREKVAKELALGRAEQMRLDADAAWAVARETPGEHGDRR